jgi:hypothetical protein
MMSSSTVQTVKHLSFETFLNSKWPVLPRVLLVASKADISATFRAVSTLFASRAMFGQATVADARLLDALGIDAASAPVLLVSGAGPFGPVQMAAAAEPKEEDTADEDDDDDDDEEDGKKKKAKKSKKSKKSKKAKKPAEQVIVPGSLSAAKFGWTVYRGTKGDPAAASTAGFTFAALREFLDEALPEPAVPQLKSPADFERVCGNNVDASVCFVAMLPPGAASRAAVASKVHSATDLAAPLASAEAASPIAALTSVVRVASQPLLSVDWSTLPAQPNANMQLRADRLPMTVAWVDAEAQREWASVFRTAVPGIVAINPRKRAFASFKGSFNAPDVYEFVSAMMNAGAPMGATAKPKGAAGDEETMSAFEKRRAELVKMETLPSGVPALADEADAAAALAAQADAATEADPDAAEILREIRGALDDESEGKKGKKGKKDKKGKDTKDKKEKKTKKGSKKAAKEDKDEL